MIVFGNHSNGPFVVFCSVSVLFCVCVSSPDPFTPMEEIVRGFNHIIDKGQAFYWATSGKADRWVDSTGDVVFRFVFF